MDQLQSISASCSHAETEVRCVGKSPASLREVHIVPKYYNLLLTGLPRYVKYFKLAALVRKVFCA
jgi:hypothetical protein